MDITVYSKPPIIGGGYTVYGRHRGQGLNFIFVDGHGEFLKKGKWSTISGSVDPNWWPYSAWDPTNPHGIWAE